MPQMQETLLPDRLRRLDPVLQDNECTRLEIPNRPVCVLTFVSPGRHSLIEPLLQT
jgi:hypothetical protein